MKSLVFALVFSFILLLGCSQQNTQNNANLTITASQDTTGSSAQEINSMPKVQKGDTVLVNYKGTLEDGSEFDSSLKPGRTPLEFTVGAGQMIKGFDAAVIGMKAGEEKTVTLKPSEAYGERREDTVQFVPKENFGEIFDQLQVGQQVQASNGLTPTVIEKTSTGAKLDFNHFLAGKKLVFWIKVEKIQKA